jgi:methionyl-tRNA formyltransferase
MRAVILTASGSEHIYVANALAHALGDRLAGIVIESPSKGHTAAASLARAVKRYGLARAIERVVTKGLRTVLRHGPRQAAAHRTVLGSHSPQWPDSLPVVRTASVNAPEAAEFIRAAQATHLFIYGTGIVRNATLQLATVGALNMHTGVSPYYRGCDTEFWPLYSGEPHMVGITVHDCTAALDGGAIHAGASVDLEPDDDAFLAFARCVKVGAEVYASVAARLADGTPRAPRPQDLATGRLYRFVDRTFAHDLAMECKVRLGIVRRSIERMRSHERPFPRPKVEW